MSISSNSTRGERTIQRLPSGRIFEIRSCGTLDQARDSAPADPADAPVTMADLRASHDAILKTYKTPQKRSRDQILADMIASTDRMIGSKSKTTDTRKPKAKSADGYPNDPLERAEEFADKAHERATIRGNDGKPWHPAAPVGLRCRDESVASFQKAVDDFGATLRGADPYLLPENAPLVPKVDMPLTGPSSITSYGTPMPNSKAATFTESTPGETASQFQARVDRDGAEMRRLTSEAKTDSGFDPPPPALKSEPRLAKMPVTGVEAIAEVHVSTNDASYGQAVADAGQRMRDAFRR